MKCPTARLCALTLILINLSSTASAELIYGIAAVGNATNLVSWDSANPSNLLSGTFLTGLQPNETIVGIDVRRANGKLYALGSTSRLYTIDPPTGAVTLVSSSSFSPVLNGFSFGFDFNQAIDRIRVVSDTNTNLVLDPNDGTLQTVATNLAYAPTDPFSTSDPNVVHSAYTNSLVQPELYGIDVATNRLVKQANNSGVLQTVSAFSLAGGQDISSIGGFDISAATGDAYAALLLADQSESRFFKINLATGTASGAFVGGSNAIGGGLIITAMATASAVPEPSTTVIAMLALAGAPLLRRKR